MNVSSAIGGIQAGSLLLGASADNIANLLTPDYRATRVDLATDAAGGVSARVSKAAEPGVDLVDQMAGLITAGVMYDASATVLRHMAEHEQSLFDALA